MAHETIGRQLQDAANTGAQGAFGLTEGLRRQADLGQDLITAVELVRMVGRVIATTAKSNDLSYKQTMGGIATVKRAWESLDGTTDDPPEPSNHLDDAVDKLRNVFVGNTSTLDGVTTNSEGIARELDKAAEAIEVIAEALLAATESAALKPRRLRMA